MTTRTILSTLNGLFPNISESDNKIPTTSFLQAVTIGILPIYDNLGPGFGIVKNDIHGNVKKLEKKQAMNCELYVTIDAMLEDEAIKKDTDLASNSALWLTRGLDFICAFYENLLKNKDDPSEYATSELKEAYSSTLKQYHGFLLQKVMYTMAKFLAYKTTILKALKIDPNVEDCIVYEEMEVYVKLMRSNVDHLNVLLKQFNMDSDEVAEG